METQADWLELSALTAADRNYSITDLAAEIGRGGTFEAVADLAEDEPRSEASALESEQLQPLASEALAEAEKRLAICGRGYPFSVHERYVQAGSRAASKLYTFLLLLSQFGPNAGPADRSAPRIFERVAGFAAQRYLAGGCRDGTARHYLLGSPRELTPSSFRDAVNTLCRELGEGQGCRVDRPRLSDVKDGKVDLVAWVPFADGREGQVVCFGQCATGANWHDKLSELQPMVFCHKWLKDQFAMEPGKMFFMPHRIPGDDWQDVSMDAGVVFDRARIVAAVGIPDRGLLQDCVEWSAHVLREWKDR